MNITFLNLVGQLVNDVGAVALVIGRFFKAIGLWLFHRLIYPPLLTIIVLCLFMFGLNFMLTGCIPATYMAYKNGTEPVNVTPSNETERLLINMNKLGCQIALYEEELAAYKERRTVGCATDERR